MLVRLAAPCCLAVIRLAAVLAATLVAANGTAALRSFIAALWPTAEWRDRLTAFIEDTIQTCPAADG
jgi:hypothetical protein